MHPKFTQSEDFASALQRCAKLVRTYSINRSLLVSTGMDGVAEAAEEAKRELMFVLLGDDDTAGWIATMLRKLATPESSILTPREIDVAIRALKMNAMKLAESAEVSREIAASLGFDVTTNSFNEPVEECKRIAGKLAAPEQNNLDAKD